SPDLSFSMMPPLLAGARKSIRARACIDIRARACILPIMMTDTQKHQRPAGLSAGGAFLCAEAWQSGLSHRAYLPADLWASKPLAGSRPFESDRFHHHNQWDRAVGSSPAPCLSPRDWAPKRLTDRNIRRFSHIRHLATLSHNVSDWARHELPLP